MTNDLKEAVRVLKKGGVVVFPTDTVWGIGALASSKKGTTKLYKIKKREKNKPTAILVSDIKMASNYGVMDEAAKKLAIKHWPGALTLIVKAGNKKVGLRAPKHKLVLELIKELDEGVMAASANFAGERAPKTRKAIDKRLISMVDIIVKGEAGGEEASTVIDVSVSPWKLLREGPVEVANSEW